MKLSKPKRAMMWYLPLLNIILFLSSICSSSSQNIIKNLPGYSGDLPFKLETGYIGVGEVEDVQLFYYFIESERSPKDDPLFLWLTGGPGCSSFSGLVYEIGPLQFAYSNSSERAAVFKLNPYSWTKVANIIFVDSPVGTGFSYSKNSQSSSSSDTLQAYQLYEFLRKWLLIHPQFLINQLYIAGDSYSGKIGPILVEEIYNGTEVGVYPKMNLKGYILGNPVTYEEKDISMRIPYTHRVGLISDELYQSAEIYCHGDYMNVDPSNAGCINALQNVSRNIEKIDPAHILEPTCKILSPGPNNRLTWNRSLLDEEENIDVLLSSRLSKNWCREYNYLFSFVWANDKEVRKALHIREGTKDDWVRCNQTLSYTKNVLSSVPYHKRLSKKYLRALIYSGDHDMVVPYIGTNEWIKSLNLTPFFVWDPWFVNGQVAGYSSLYLSTPYDLTYTTIKGGGHTAPEYRPEECLAMIERWLAYYPL